MAQHVNRFSYMSLRLEMRSKMQHISTGTGFIGISPMGRPTLITARQNLTGRHADTNLVMNPRGMIPDEVRMTYRAVDTPPDVIGWTARFEDLYEVGEAPRWIEHPTYGSAIDVAALPLEHYDGIMVHPFLGPNAAP